MGQQNEWLSPVGVDLVWFSGPDAVRFLNDLISQEVADMAPGSVRRSLLLGPQGKLDHILWALRGDELVGLVTSEGRGGELATTLGRYRIRVKVDIETEERPLWVVMGKSVDGWSGVRDGSLEADVSWRATPRCLVAGDRPDLEAGSTGDYETARILSGEPAWGVDVDEGTIPQEAGLVEESVDFTKGCYLGQELVARIDSRGRVVRKLRLLELDGPVEPGAEVSVDGKPVGVLTSVQGRVGLGVLRFEVEPGAVVQVGSATATVRETF
jgi:tRNA-modifying protein YgfZ